MKLLSAITIFCSLLLIVQTHGQTSTSTIETTTNEFSDSSTEPFTSSPHETQTDDSNNTRETTTVNTIQDNTIITTVNTIEETTNSPTSTTENSIIDTTDNSQATNESETTSESSTSTTHDSTSTMLNRDNATTTTTTTTESVSQSSEMTTASQPPEPNSSEPCFTSSSIEEIPHPTTGDIPSSTPPVMDPITEIMVSSKETNQTTSVTRGVSPNDSTTAIEVSIKSHSSTSSPVSTGSSMPGLFSTTSIPERGSHDSTAPNLTETTETDTSATDTQSTEFPKNSTIESSHADPETLIANEVEIALARNNWITITVYSIINLTCLIVVAVVVYYCTARRGKWYAPPPSTTGFHDVRMTQGSTGYHLATDDDCKAQEMSGRSFPVQPKDGWCVPLQKESYTKTADSGV